MNRAIPGRGRRVALFGYFGAWNLGDESVVGVLIAEIRRRWPDSTIQAICLNPDLTQQQHGIPAIPLRRLPRDHNGETSQGNGSRLLRLLRKVLALPAREFVFLVQSFRRLKGFDMVIVTGSGPLIDNEGGPWNHPFNQLKWSCLARLRGAQFLFVSVGAGPIETRLGKWLIKRALSMASYRSFRDDSSLRLIESIGVKGRNLVYPDQAFNLDSAPYHAKSRKSHGPPLVAVAPIAYADPRHWPSGDQTFYERYLHKIASFVIDLARSGHRVLLFHTQLHGDDRAVAEVQEIVRMKGDTSIQELIEEHPIRWYPDSLEAISRSDVVVASRFHAVLFSMILRRPVLAVSYDRKIDDVMEATGLGDYCFPIGTFTPEQLATAMAAVESRTECIRDQLEAKVQAYRKRLAEQYDHVFS